jgi:microcystin-dependent protein
MARNGTGTYSVPNTFASGASITATGHNENWSDLAAEMTNSVAADGQTTMTGPLKASTGTVSAPSLSFGADTNTGLYRSTSDEMSGVAGGVQIHKTNSTGFNVVSGKVRESGNSIVPSGVIWPYGGSSAPSGFLLCDGSAVSRTTYADLYSAIGTAYGTGDGSTTFNVPDLTGRVPAGKEATATRLTSAVGGVDGGTLGASGGTQSVTLTQAQIPAHTHSAGTLSGSSAVTSLNNAASGSGTDISRTISGNASAVVITGSTGSIGSDSAHANVQPTLIVNYIIKV